MNVSKTLEKALEEAQLCGELKLIGRRLKDFPKMAYKFDLTDTIYADLSKNKFTELCEEITCLSFLEKLLISYNAIKFIPESIINMNSLQYLDIRNNQLQWLSKEICFLPLKVLLISNNRLNALPEEIGRLEFLTELDAAHNFLQVLPVRIGELKKIMSLNFSNNQLVYLPRDICSLKLSHLDVSSNRISSLPKDLRHMTSLITLDTHNNPLTSPPARLCAYGLVHIFKYLEGKGNCDEKDNNLIPKHKASPTRSVKHAATVPLDRDRKRQQVFQVNDNNSKKVGAQENYTENREINLKIYPIIVNNNRNEMSLPASPNKTTFSQIQTYKEYKEALKQQRQDVYKREVTSPTNTVNDVSVSLNQNLTNENMNGNHIENENSSPYVKPNGPLKINANSTESNSSTKKLSKTVSWNQDITTSDTKNFTMRREYDKQREESELIKQLRSIIKSRLKMNLPDDLASALQDGVVLCHLANYVRARSITSIHVPSSTTPKLTVTRCRRNVDNFLFACQKIGVDEKLICCAADILEGKGLVQVAITVVELLKFQPNSIKSPTEVKNF